MPLRFAERADEAYSFPLTIGHLLDAALTTSGDQEIVYRDQLRFTYRELRQRIGRLAAERDDEHATVVRMHIRRAAAQHGDEVGWVHLPIIEAAATGP